MEGPTDGIDWSSLSFSQTRTEYMVKCVWTREEQKWGELRCEPYGPLGMEVAAGVLNYGFSVFEGLNAFRWEDGSIRLFRADKNARRMQRSAERLTMPPLDEDVFLRAMKACVAANAKFTPPCGEGALYLRPLLFGSGSQLAGPPGEYTFVVYASPVGNYFQKKVRMLVTRDFHRSVIGGVGAIKAAGNYVPTFLPKKLATEEGFDEVLYLDARGNDYIEEASSSNLFLVKDGVLYTPDLSRKTCLAGVTRESLIHLAREKLGLRVIDDQPVLASSLKDATEIFLSGTGVGISPVGSVFLDGEEYWAKEDEIAPKLKALLREIQNGKADAPEGWIMEVTASDLMPVAE